MITSLPKHTLALAAGALLSLSLPATADQLTKESLTKATESINQQLKAKKQSPKDFSSWFALLEQENYTELKQQIRYQGSSAETTKLIAAIDATIKAKEEEVIAEVEATYDAILKQVTTALENSKKPADLDTTLTALSKAKAKLTLYRNNYSFKKLSRVVQEAEQGYRNATQLVASWQEYLTYRAAGNNSSARSALNSISSNLKTFPIIPRSKILQLREGVSSTKKPSVEQISEFDKIVLRFAEGLPPQDTYQLLKEASLSSYKRKEADKLMMRLAKILQYQKGTHTLSTTELIQLFKGANRNDSLESHQISALYARLLISSLDHEFSFKNTKPSASPSQHIETILEHLIAQQSWDQAQEVLSYLTSINNPNHYNIYRNLQMSIKNAKNGDACLDADLWVDAIKYYRLGLKESSLRLPSSLFAQKLANMRKADAERYTEASKIVDDLNIQQAHSQVAGTIWRLNQYIQRQGPYANQSRQPIPPQLQNVIEQFVELEVEKRLRDHGKEPVPTDKK